MSRRGGEGLRVCEISCHNGVAWCERPNGDDDEGAGVRTGKGLPKRFALAALEGMEGVIDETTTPTRREKHRANKVPRLDDITLWIRLWW